MGSISENLFGSVGSYLGGQSGKKHALTGYRYAQDNLGSYVDNGSSANNQISNLLMGSSAQAGQAFQNWQNSTGYRNRVQGGTDAIQGSAASRGLLNSGATAKALTSYGQQQAASSLADYLAQLGGLSTQGLQAGSTITGAGTQGGLAAGEAMNSGIYNAFRMQGRAIDEGAKTFASMYTGNPNWLGKGGAN